MNTMRLVRHSAGMMSRHKLRTVFMMFGSVLGVAALTLVISVGQAAKQKMLTMVRQVFGEASIMVMDGGGHMMGGPRKPGTRRNSRTSKRSPHRCRELRTGNHSRD